MTHLKRQKLDVVIGSRFLGEVKNISSRKRLLLKGARLFSKATSGINLSDPHNGLQVYNRAFAENLKLTLSDFTHKSEIVERIRKDGYKFGESPVTVTYTDYSRIKGQPMINAINIAFDMLFYRISGK